MTDTPDINRAIIEQFRANGGQVTGPAEGFTLLLLHNTGARTGVERVNPLSYLPVADGWAVFAAHAGAAKTPDWFHNIVKESFWSVSGTNGHLSSPSFLKLVPNLRQFLMLKFPQNIRSRIIFGNTCRTTPTSTGPVVTASALVSRILRV